MFRDPLFKLTYVVRITHYVIERRLSLPKYPAVLAVYSKHFYYTILNYTSSESRLQVKSLYTLYTTHPPSLPLTATSASTS